MRSARILAVFVFVGLLLALTLTWATEAKITRSDGECEVVEHKPSWSLSYSVERTCP